MKGFHVLFLAIVFFGIGLPLQAGPEHDIPKTEPSKELTLVQKLEGVWKGTETTEGKTIPAEIHYKLTSGGSTVVETLKPGSEHEMVSVYYDENGELRMKHYCMLPAKPQLDLVSSSESTLFFDFSPENKIDLKEWHMHSLTISLSEEGELEQTWIGYKDGKPQPPAVFTARKVV